MVIDGTLIPVDRVAADQPFYSGKHHRHGMNLQVTASPDGDIVWVSGPLPGAVQHSGLLRPRSAEVPAVHPLAEAASEQRPARQRHVAGLLDAVPGVGAPGDLADGRPRHPADAPNSKGGPAAHTLHYGEPTGWHADGDMVRTAYTLHEQDDDWGQVGTMVREVLDDAARDRLVSNIVGHLLSGVTEPVLLQRAFEYWRNVDKDLSNRVEKGVRAGQS